MTSQVSGTGGASTPLAYADTEPDGVPLLNDPAAQLLALILQNRSAQGAVSEADIERAKKMLEEMRREINEALQRAAQAEEHHGFLDKLSSFFSGDIGVLCEVIAAAAVIAATGGVGAAGVLAVAAAGLSLSSDVAQHAGASPAVCAGISLTGAAVGLASGNVASASEAWSAVATGAKIVHCAADIAAAGALTAATEWHATALDHQADATEARGQQNIALVNYDLAIEALARATRDTTRAEQGLSNVVQTQNDGRMALIARLGAA
jgi:hypothetical protein